MNTQKPTCRAEIVMSEHEMELHQKDRQRRNEYRIAVRNQRIAFFIRLTLLVGACVGIYLSIK